MKSVDCTGYVDDDNKDLKMIMILLIKKLYVGWYGINNSNENIARMLLIRIMMMILVTLISIMLIQIMQMTVMITANGKR